MRSAKSTGRIVGMLLLIQLSGLIVPFVLLLPMAGGQQEFLTTGVHASSQVRVAVALLLVNCALTIGISITAFRLLAQFSSAAALWLLVASVIMFTLQAVDNTHLLAMLSLSTQYAHAGELRETVGALAVQVGAARKWAHTTELLAIDGWIFLFYGALYRFALVPRALSVFGLTTVLLHFVGIPLRGLAGYSQVGLMGVPMAFSHIAVGGWLLWKGFDESHRPAADGR